MHLCLDTWSFFLYNLHIFIWLQYGCLANMVFALELSNSVVKRLVSKFPLVKITCLLITPNWPLISVKYYHKDQSDALSILLECLIVIN